MQTPVSCESVHSHRPRYSPPDTNWCVDVNVNMVQIYSEMIYRVQVFLASKTQGYVWDGWTMRQEFAARLERSLLKSLSEETEIQAV